MPCSSHIIFPTQVYQNVIPETGVAIPEPPPQLNVLVTAGADNSSMPSSVFVGIPGSENKIESASATSMTKTDPDTWYNSVKQMISSISGTSPELGQRTKALVALTAKFKLQTTLEQASFALIELCKTFMFSSMYGI